MKKSAVLLVNFGGPRNLHEIRSFLTCLLTDQDVVRTNFPSFIHRVLFSRIAKKRTDLVKKQYELIGGGSPIFSDTENIASTLRKKIKMPILTFHRYLPNTHKEFFKEIHTLDADEIIVFPFFPQFTYATSGSIARFFTENLCGKITNKMLWIKSYPTHPIYLQAMEEVLQNHLSENGINEENCALIFSAHGVPCQFICTGDIYQKECEMSFQSLKERFPKALSILSYQSKFGKGEWISPSTQDVCEKITILAPDKEHVVIVPLAFPSDHIETLFEIEHEYLPLLQKNKKKAYRCPAMNHHPLWLDAIENMILNPPNLMTNPMLIRHKSLKKCCASCSKHTCFC